MAAITFINPGMIRITTTLTKEQVDVTKAINPSLLILTDEDDNQVFRVDFATSSTVTVHGVVFQDGIATAAWDTNTVVGKFKAQQVKANVELIEEKVTALYNQLNAMPEIQSI